MAIGSAEKKLRLASFLSPSGHHLGGWRTPEADERAPIELEAWINYARIAERGKFDMIFLADSQAIPNISEPEIASRDAVNRPGWFEPVTLLSALAAVTHDIGLVSTFTTTYSQPFTVARMFASLDHLSRGRAGWNIVTSASPLEATNFSSDRHMDVADRYARAAEFVEVVKGLWDSWADDAFVRDKASGRFFDPSKMFALHHRGPNFSVEGPLNVPRPPQGHPVLVQAGQSEDGRNLSAAVADVAFTVQTGRESAIAFRNDLRARAAAAGRDPESLLVMPGVCVFVGQSRQQAEERKQQLEELTPQEVAIAALSSWFGYDLSRHDPDGSLPDLSPDVLGSPSRAQHFLSLAKRDKLTLAQLAKRAATARGHWLITGTPADVADQLEDWFRAGAADGFNIAHQDLPASLEQFVDLVIPELQRRGLFRTDYEGSTLRDRLGLPRPEIRIAPSARRAAR